MPETDLSISEAIYCIETMKSDGIVLLASSYRKFLGDNIFDDLMNELNKINAVVFIHPNIHPTCENLNLQTPGY